MNRMPHIAYVLTLATSTACTALTEEAGRMLLGTGASMLHERGLDHAAKATDNLGRQFDSSMATRRLLEDLDALAGAGVPDALARVAPHLRSDDARVRLAAVGALRADASDEAVAALAERLAQDAAPEVRLAAAQLLAGRPAAAAREAMANAARADVSAPLRQVIAQYLAAADRRL
jgi:hypothetical protein